MAFGFYRFDAVGRIKSVVAHMFSLVNKKNAIKEHSRQAHTDKRDIHQPPMKPFHNKNPKEVRNRHDENHRKTERQYWVVQNRIAKYGNCIAGVGVLFSVLATGAAGVAAWFAYGAYLQASLEARAAVNGNSINQAAYVAANRPWIKVTIAPSDFIWKPQGVLFRAGMISPSVYAENFGNSPALNVQISIGTYLGGSKQDSVDVLQKRACKMLAQIPFNVGAQLFQNEKIDLNDQRGGRIWTGIDDFQIEKIPGAKLNGFGFILYGCVDYVFGSKHYQTVFAYQAWRVVTNQYGKDYEGFMIGQNVLAENIFLAPTWQGNYAN